MMLNRIGLSGPARRQKAYDERRGISRILGSAVILAIAGTSVSRAAIVQTHYRVTDLGTFGGNLSYANAINSMGDVAGVAYSPTAELGFLYKNGVLQQLTSLPGYGYSAGSALNDSDQVVGDSGMHPAIWNGANPPQQLFNDLGSTGCVGITNTGQVAGSTYLAGAWTWTSGTGVKYIGTLGGTYSVANGENQLGHIVGRSRDVQADDRAFLWRASDGFHNLGTLGGLSEAFGVNNSDQVVGDCDPPNVNGSRAFLWDPVNGMQNLGTIGIGSSTAYAINNIGQVVGTSFGKAFIWDSVHGMVDLNTLISANSVMSLVQANGINDAGQIVGYGYTSVGGFQHAFLLTPVPEPASLLLLLIGGLAVGGSTVYKRRRKAGQDSARDH
jgi:probable HAF family extracellular repeat protein